MKKRLAILAVAAGAIATLGFGGSAQAGCDQGGPSAGHTEAAELPGTGSHIYTSGGGAGSTSGYAGIHGGIGYLEAGGSADSGSGSIQGSTTDGAVDGKLSGDSGGLHLCVNDTSVL